MMKDLTRRCRRSVVTFVVAFFASGAWANECRALPRSGQVDAATFADHYQFDVTTGLYWAVILYCLHPERPARLSIVSRDPLPPDQKPEQAHSGYCGIMHPIKAS